MGTAAVVANCHFYLADYNHNLTDILVWLQYNTQSLTSNWTVAGNSQKLAMVLRGAANPALGYRLFYVMISETEAGSNAEPWFSKLIEVQRYIENRDASAIKHKIREFSDQVCSKMMSLCLFHLLNLMKDKYKYEQHWS